MHFNHESPLHSLLVLPGGLPGGSTSSFSCPSADGVYEIGGLFPVWAVVVIAGTALAAVTFFATSNSKPPRLHWVRTLDSLSRGGDTEVSWANVLDSLATNHFLR